ncbi:MAG TPA: hypothetical protein VII58_01930 [Acidobacteriaceae bacterium]
MALQTPARALRKVALLCAALPCAQSLPAQLSANAPQAPQANPGRPTVSTPATLTPVGYLQFENGGLYAASSPNASASFGINQVTKLAVVSRLQLLLVSQPFGYGSGTSGGELSGSHPGDILTGAQAVALPGRGYRPTVSLSYLGRVYQGSAPDVDIGSASQTALLLVSDDLAGLHFDINAIVAEQPGDRIRRAQFGQTLSVSRALGRYTIAGELWHFTQPLTGGNCAGSLWALSYNLRPNLVLDTGLNRGLTSTSTQWEGFAGFTYLLPHRLWKSRDSPSHTPARQPFIHSTLRTPDPAI